MLIKLFPLALLLGGSLHAAPLSITLLGRSPDFSEETYAIDGPLGRETYTIVCCNENFGFFLQNDHWQLVLRAENSANPPRWYVFNYGRGAGDYGMTDRIMFGFDTPLDVPGFTIPDGFCCIGASPTVRVEASALSNSGILTGNVLFLDVFLNVSPNGPSPGDQHFDIYSIPFAYDLGANPHFVPEPASMLMAGLGLFVLGSRFTSRSRFRCSSRSR